MTSSLCLVDCNNFFAACEVALNPRLQGKPLLITGHNAGCIIARSPQARTLGIPMGAPLHTLKQQIEQHHIEVMSANFTLYASLSARILRILSQFAPAMETFSIDESWLDFGAMPLAARLDHAKEIKQTIEQWVGVPVSLAIAETKVMTKLAMLISKKRADGVYAFKNEEELDAYLAQLRTEEIFGISTRRAQRLRAGGIYTGLELKRANERWVKQELGVVGLRIVYELRGIPCLPLEESPGPRKQLMCARAFGQDIGDLPVLQDAVANYTITVAERLRRQGSVSRVVGVWLATNPFQANQPQESRSATITLPAATNDTAHFLAAAQRLTERLYKAGVWYHRAGISLLDLSPDRHQQLTLLQSPTELEERQALMHAIDRINMKWGKGTITYGAVSKEHSWQAKQVKISPRYTTRASEVPTAR